MNSAHKTRRGILITLGLCLLLGLASRADALTIPSASLRDFDQCVKSDVVVQRWLQQLGEFLGTRQYSAEVILSRWYSAVDEIPMKFTRNVNRKTLQRSISRLERLTSKGIEQGLILMIGSAAGRCQVTVNQLLNHTIDYLYDAKYLVEEMQTVDQLLANLNQANESRSAIIDKVRRIDQLHKRLGM